MSSHHIVREGQEPALIIANGASCSNTLTEQLLEWSPFIVVLDGALDRVLDMGIKFDVVLGDFDHQSLDSVRDRIPPDTLIEYVPNQDKTDLEKGIEYLIDRKFTAVNIIWATGRRSDHYMNNIGILGRYNHQIDQVMLDDHSKIYPIKSGFKKHFVKGENVSLIPLNKVENIRTSNLQWNLNGHTLEFPYHTSSSNKVVETGLISIEFDKGIVLMMECFD
ncbi:MAG: thiamine diphosphokinase [Bacteroidetes bacterium]|nr:thiamine diphosphokinase [Bacteroidota bacterium]